MKRLICWLVGHRYREYTVPADQPTDSGVLRLMKHKMRLMAPLSCCKRCGAVR